MSAVTPRFPLPLWVGSFEGLKWPGQQLLPGYVVKLLLKTVKIPFGTDRTMNGVDVDPTVALLSHIVDCMGALARCGIRFTERKDH